MNKSKVRRFKSDATLTVKLVDGTVRKVTATKFPDVAELQVAGKLIKIPYRCPKCHDAGLLLMHRDDCGRVDVVCGPREDATGQYFKGCSLTVTSFPINERDWEWLMESSITHAFFFCMDMLNVRTVFPNIGELPIYPKMTDTKHLYG